MTQELLPCPFCGSEASGDGYIRYSKPLEDTLWDGGLPITDAHFCNCVKCGLTNQGVVGIGYQTKADAIAAWNTRSAPQWQPIETAPKDGTRFLAKMNSDIDGIRVCWFAPDEEYGGEILTDEGDTEPFMTHWMPVST